eukprot:CAMPEP_0194137656 /NCGR_PEP_ID=MMETSP0152-20130528/7516_1 /TAXON_ID=1049557 /ORGANISM="Thalassiothrix antarctica, Strain L6-D1" /LENGTH=178 /DNA_ID=CAMNT_0038834763 /DNA_START=72 /DNA_END=605 /DNA_ORIENTATION=+
MTPSHGQTVSSFKLLSSYRPWYCRHENKNWRFLGKKHVETLMDQPSHCLRNTTASAAAQQHSWTATVSNNNDDIEEEYVSSFSSGTVILADDTIEYSTEFLKYDLSFVKPIEPTITTVNDMSSSNSNDDDDWMYVNTPKKLQQCRKELEESGCAEIGFDLEFWNPSKYYGRTCLLQLS